MKVKRIARINFERTQLMRLRSFIVLTAHALDCNSILSLKRALRAHLVSVKFYKNASVKLAFGARYPSAFGAIKGQHMFLVIERDVSEACKLVSAFAQAHAVSVQAFVWANALYNSECVYLIARTANEAALRAYVLFALKRVLSRFVAALALPLTNFVSLLNRSSEHV
ncbi:MAG: 50S ribosomal protein L10 [Candidatus Hodgkinia cicadicola]